MMTSKVRQLERVGLIERANAQNAAYPQYAGYFNGYQLARIKRRIRTKLGLAFEAGELVIADPNYNDPGWVLAYSFRNRCCTVIAANKVEWK